MFISLTLRWDSVNIRKVLLLGIFFLMVFNRTLCLSRIPRWDCELPIRGQDGILAFSALWVWRSDLALIFPFLNNGTPTSFLTTLYGLYFNHRLHITISSSSYMSMVTFCEQLSCTDFYTCFFLICGYYRVVFVFSTKLLRVHAHSYAQGLGAAYQPYARVLTV